MLEWGFVAWLAGVLASVPFWQSSIYTGSLANSFGGGDVSMYVGFVVAMAGVPRDVAELCRGGKKRERRGRGIFGCVSPPKPLWRLKGESDCRPRSPKQ